MKLASTKLKYVVDQLNIFLCRKDSWQLAVTYQLCTQNICLCLFHVRHNKEIYSVKHAWTIGRKKVQTNKYFTVLYFYWYSKHRDKSAQSSDGNAESNLCLS